MTHFLYWKWHLQDKKRPTPHHTMEEINTRHSSLTTNGNCYKVGQLDLVVLRYSVSQTQNVTEPNKGRGQNLSSQ